MAIGTQTKAKPGEMFGGSGKGVRILRGSKTSSSEQPKDSDPRSPVQILTDEFSGDFRRRGSEKTSVIKTGEEND